MKSCTDLEQSKRLIELGLDVETSDMHYIEDSSDNPYCELYASKLNEEARKYYNIHYIPAWSLSALLDLMPSEFAVEGKFGTFTYKVHIRKYKFNEDTDLYQIAYGNYGNSGSWHDMINTGEHESLLDAAFEMVCWLKENGKL